MCLLLSYPSWFASGCIIIPQNLWSKYLFTFILLCKIINSIMNEYMTVCHTLTVMVWHSSWHTLRHVSLCMCVSDTAGPDVGGLCTRVWPIKSLDNLLHSSGMVTPQRTPTPPSPNSIPSLFPPGPETAAPPSALTTLLMWLNVWVHLERKPLKTCYHSELITFMFP